jgi:membrane-associated phospholipid phosphatase
MFTTELNHWLQSFNHPVVYWFFETVSMMGTVVFLTFLLYIVIAGVDFRKGFWIAGIFLYTVLLTVLLKETIDFPRPIAVDTTLNSYGRDAGSDLLALQPKEFFGVFSDEILQEIRKDDAGRYGFPSGHTSLITAIFLSCALFFRKKWLWYLTPTLILLTMLSRMYLGRHYLADVLGGLILGLTVTFGIYLLSKAGEQINSQKLTLKEKIFLLSPLILLPFYKIFPAFQTGSFIGLSLASFLIIYIWGIPVFDKKIYKRILSTLIFFLIGYTVIYVGKRIGLEKYALLSIFYYLTGNLLSLLLSAFLCMKLKLWR